MRKYLVMTVTGHDHPGIVDRITQLLLNHDANVESSKMSRLAGEFAMLMLVSVPANKFEALREDVRVLQEENYKVTTSATERGTSSRFAGWIPYQVRVNGADHEGIIYEIAHRLARRGINIESLDTGMFKAPMSGTPLFKMTAVVVVPPDLPVQEWRREMEDVGDELGVDVEISSYVG